MISQPPESIPKKLRWLTASRSPYAIHHVNILSTLLSPDAGRRALGPDGSQAATEISRYLVEHEYQQYFSQALLQVVCPSPSIYPVIDTLASLPSARHNMPHYQHSSSSSLPPSHSGNLRHPPSTERSSVSSRASLPYHSSSIDYR